jgi:hypothetical protein
MAGHGQLRIKNGTESDALVTLVDSVGALPVVATYVWRGSTITVNGVLRGTYFLRFQFGRKWLAEQRFCAIDDTSEFENVLDFSEVTDTTGTTYSRHTVTLYAVPSGNAETKALPNTPLPIR